MGGRRVGGAARVLTYFVVCALIRPRAYTFDSKYFEPVISMMSTVTNMSRLA